MDAGELHSNEQASIDSAVEFSVRTSFRLLVAVVQTMLRQATTDVAAEDGKASSAWLEARSLQGWDTRGPALFALM